MFLSTQKPDHVYNFIVNSCKIHAEKIYKKKLQIEFLKKAKKPSLKFLIFILYLIITGKIFLKNRVYIKFYDIEIGRHVNSSTNKKFETYVSKSIFFIEFIKNLYRAGINLETCKWYLKNKKIKAAYIDHCTYLNGIMYSYFGKHNIPIYTNNYPYSIFMIDFRKRKNNRLVNYENVIKIGLKKKLNIFQKKKSKKILKELTFKKNYLSWMKRVKFENLNKTNYKNFNYLIYAHSFTDGQLVYGNDGFENSLDWLDFTLKTLEKNNKKVLIKAHPNFYEDSYGILSYWDKKIFSQITDKYKNNKNFLFIKKPIFNYELLNKINNKCILVTHHGTVILEGAYLNFKTISSQCTFYDDTFKHAVTWKNKNEYLQLLKKKFENLPNTKKDDLYSLVYNLFYDKFSYYSSNSWQKIIAKYLKITPEEFTNKIAIFSGMKKNEIEEKKYFFKKKIGNNFKKIINKLSLNITEIELNKKNLKNYKILEN